MAEESHNPPQPRPGPGKSRLYELLALVLLLVVMMAVFALIYRQGLTPDFLLPATPTRTLTPAETSPPETTSSSYLSLVNTLTAAPLVETQLAETPTEGTLLEGTLTDETPTVTETPIPPTPVPPTPAAPSPTPAFGSCQYTLKPGPGDFLYAIYLSWHIKENIPVVKDYYASIYCAALLSNLKCDYQASNPNITQSGWILVLPGVSAQTCSAHAGTPVP